MFFQRCVDYGSDISSRESCLTINNGISFFHLSLSVALSFLSFPLANNNNEIDRVKTFMFQSNKNRRMKMYEVQLAEPYRSREPREN